MSPISPTNALSEPLPVDLSLSSVLLNAPTMVRTELGTRLVKDRNSLEFIASVLDSVRCLAGDTA